MMPSAFDSDKSDWLFGPCMTCGHDGPEHTVYALPVNQVVCTVEGCTCAKVLLQKKPVEGEHVKNGKLVCTPGLDEIYYDDRFGSGNWLYCHSCKGVHHNKYHMINSVTAEDPVNHPSHYTMYKGLEIIDLTEQMNFNKGNAVKYIARAGFKGGPEKEVEDLEKAQWYISRELERIKQNPDDIP